MLKVEIGRSENGRKTGSCQLMGSEREIGSEVLDALGTIYAAMRDEFSPSFLEMFRRILIVAVLDPNSPVWTTRQGSGEKIVFRPPPRKGGQG